MKIIVEKKHDGFIAYFEGSRWVLGRGKTSGKAIVDLLNRTPDCTIVFRTV